MPHVDWDGYGYSLSSSGKEIWMVPIFILLVSRWSLPGFPKHFPKLWGHWTIQHMSIMSMSPYLLSLLFLVGLYLERCHFLMFPPSRLQFHLTSPLPPPRPPASPDTPYAAHAVAVLSTRPKRKCEILELSQESHHVTVHRQQSMGRDFCGFKGSKKSENFHPRAPLGTQELRSKPRFSAASAFPLYTSLYAVV